jgi:hypothetical protein
MVAPYRPKVLRLICEECNEPFEALLAMPARSGSRRPEVAGCA